MTSTNETTTSATLCTSRMVVTYRLAYVPGHSIELCDACAKSWDGATLGQVLHGRHSGHCGREHASA